MRRIPLALVLASCGSADVGNELPVAALTVSPELVVVGETAMLDASRSSDPDGLVIEYRFQFTDGTPEVRSGDARIPHTFRRGGYYEVAVVAVDDRGGEGRAAAAITVIEDPGPPPMCDPGLTRCDGRCVDTTSDPDHCGGCNRPCDDGTCVASMCTANLPPGTIVFEGMSPFGANVSGLTAESDDVFWALVDFRFLEQFDPTTLEIFAEFTIVNPMGRRGFGLAMDQSRTFLATSSIPVGSPMSIPRLDVYDTNGVLVDSFDDAGGALSSVGDQFYIFQNSSQQLYQFDGSGNLVSITPIGGFPGMIVFFTDLAVVPGDPPQFAWLARPSVGPLEALLVRVDILAGVVVEIVDLPDPSGVGGLVVQGGTLWAMGASSFYGIVP